MQSQREDRQVILEALTKVMLSVTGVAKDGKNDFHGYSFVSEAGLVEAVREPMLEAGLYLIGPQVSKFHGVDSSGVVTFEVSYQLTHASGAVWPEPLTVLAQGCDRDSKGTWGDKGSYKGHTGAHKYVLLRLLNLVTGQEPEDDSPGQQTRRDEPTSRQSTDRPAQGNGERPRGGGGGVDLKALYRAGFKAAEEVYGKNLTSDQKWEPLNYGLEKLGVRTAKRLDAGQVANALVFIREWRENR